MVQLLNGFRKGLCLFFWVFFFWGGGRRGMEMLLFFSEGRAGGQVIEVSVFSVFFCRFSFCPCFGGRANAFFFFFVGLGRAGSTNRFFCVSKVVGGDVIRLLDDLGKGGANGFFFFFFAGGQFGFSPLF